MLERKAAWGGDGPLGRTPHVAAAHEIADGRPRSFDGSSPASTFRSIERSPIIVLFALQTFLVRILLGKSSSVLRENSFRERLGTERGK